MHRPSTTLVRFLFAALAWLGVAGPPRVAHAQSVVHDDPLITPAGSAPHLVDKTFFTRHDLVPPGAGVAASAIVSVFDVRIARWAQSPNAQGSTSRYNAVKSLTVINEQPLTIAAIATWGIGRLVRSSTIADVGLHTTEALVITIAASEAIRGPLGRARPRESMNSQYNFLFWGGFTDFARRSYPSLRAAAAFSVATALTEEIHGRNPSAARWAGPVLFAAATVPGFTRIYLNQHWASDIVAGSVLGAMLGAKVVTYAHSHHRTRLDRFLLGTAVVPNPTGGVLVMKTIEQ